MSADRKPVIEKRYAIPSKDSIRFVAESEGHEIDDETISLLCEDVSYRLRQVVQSASKFMRHAKRRKLTTDDVNMALRHADIQPVLGHHCAEAAHFHHVREADVFVCEDPEVSLLDVALGDDPVPHPGESSVKAYWLAVEGVHRTSAQKPSERKVSDDLLVYYDQTAKALLSTDLDLMRTALADLRTNPKILPIFPYLVNLVCQGVGKVSHDVSQLMRLLQTIQALMCNDALFMEPRPYLSMLVQAVLYCTTEPLTASVTSSNDHWRLRDYGARLLAQITNKWNNIVNQMMHKNTQLLKEVLLSSDRPSSSHYGAVVALTALGNAALEKILLPFLPTYLNHRQELLSSGGINTRLEAYKVDGAILIACCKLLTHKDGDAHKLAHLYRDLQTHYGDALYYRLPQEHSCMLLVCRKPPVKLVLEESLRSGEEMLMEFMDMVKRDLPDDSKSEQTDQNDEDAESGASFKSERSDEFEEKPEYSHLAVKSTVNDPNLGIKLTITKRHKKNKKKRTKFNIDDVFERSMVSYHPFVFNVPRLVKWSSKAAPRDFSLDYIPFPEGLEFRRLFLTHAPYWTARKRVKKKVHVLVRSGSLLVNL